MKNSTLLARMLAAAGFSASAPAAELAPAPAETQSQSDAPAAELSALHSQVETLTAQLAEATTKMSTAEAAVESRVQAAVAVAVAAEAELSAKLADVEAKLAAAAASAAAMKLADRMTKLSAVLGDTCAAEMKAIVGDMPDAAFDTTFKMLASQANKEAASKHFTETGINAERDASAPVESLEMQILRRTYPSA